MRQDCAATGVELIADPPDMGPLYRSAAVTVVPLLSGGGTRIKILEAFAHGVPVVSTTVGAEGLDVVDGRHVLIADGADELAANICRLVESISERERLVAAGHALLAERYLPAAMRTTLGHLHLLEPQS
jgi:glycosyltransferase involved in cell wall biosynthesis